MPGNTIGDETRQDLEALRVERERQKTGVGDMSQMMRLILGGIITLAIGAFGSALGIWRQQAVMARDVAIQQESVKENQARSRQNRDSLVAIQGDLRAANEKLKAIAETQLVVRDELRRMMRDQRSR